MARDPVAEIDAITLAVSDAASAARFFRDALDFHVEGDDDRGPGAGRRVRVRLGQESVILDQRDPPGRPAPPDSRSNDRWFQHVAIVISDMEAAYGRLRAHGMERISTAPQRLPEWNPAAGGIEAFYFRGPDGHPLELISFPPGKGADRWQASGPVFLGIDHTAIVVSATEASLRFYQDGLGLAVVGGSENWGPEQERLSGVAGARVRITSLRGAGGPGVELLEYLEPTSGRPWPGDARLGDLRHAETVFTVGDVEQVLRRLAAAVPGIDTALDASAVFVRDPDGHGVRISQAV